MENTLSYKYVLSKANFQQFGLPKLAIVAAKSAREKRVFWLPTLVLRFKQVIPSGKNSLKEEEKRSSKVMSVQLHCKNIRIGHDRNRRFSLLHKAYIPFRHFSINK